MPRQLVCTAQLTVVFSPISSEWACFARLDDWLISLNVDFLISLKAQLPRLSHITCVNALKTKTKTKHKTQTQTNKKLVHCTKTTTCYVRLPSAPAIPYIARIIVRFVFFFVW